MDPVWKKNIAWFLILSMFGTLMTLALLGVLSLYAQVILGSLVIISTLAGGPICGRIGDVTLVNRPAPQNEEEEEDLEDEELKEGILNTLFPGAQVKEDSAAMNNDSNVDHSCPICLESIVAGETVISGVSCTHVFHRECAMPWLLKKRGSTEDKRGCPTCRAPMWKEEDYEAAKVAARKEANKGGDIEADSTLSEPNDVVGDIEAGDVAPRNC